MNEFKFRNGKVFGTEINAWVNEISLVRNFMSRISVSFSASKSDKFGDLIFLWAKIIIFVGSGVWVYF